ncbi:MULTISPECIES: PAS domain-containing sensor histidine kinase [unclassified Thioalkalivibrio]|uniref:sensor histidine kinase n=1 Tax=unclassified Thioalkalivibrio TaxID=2621013 RepID=UPI00037DA84A|nr:MULTISPECIES: PAS domain-containing sensor histidine kinase [unclassified Thioalkalivibrio]
MIARPTRESAPERGHAPDPSAVPSLRRVSTYVLPVLAVLTFAIFLTVSLMRLHDVEQDMRSNVDENMLWVTAQAQVASHRLDEEVHRRTLGDADARPGLRYDVLTSRLVLLDAGPQRRYVKDIGLEETLDGTFERLERIEPMIDDVAPDNVEAAHAIHAELKPLMSALNRIANAVMIEEWESTGERLDQHRASLIQAIVMMIGILVTGILLTALLMNALRQRRHAQEALAAHRDRLEIEVRNRTRDLEAERRRVVDAIDTAPDGFAAFDSDDRLILVNPQFAGLLPLPDGALDEGQTLDTLLESIRAVTRPDTEHGDPEEITADDGAQYDLEVPGRGWVQMTLRRTDDGGQVLRLADITSYKDAARSLEHSLERERGVSEFYRSFAAMASHQFRTPLAIIDSGLQRLLRRGESMDRETREGRYRQLRDTVAHMTRLIENALTSARLEGGHVSASTRPCDLRPLVEQAIETQRQITPDNPVHLSVTPDGPVMARCDRALVEQILANLLSNAGKYSPETASIEVELRAEPEKITCHVTDHGIGIPEEDQARLFDRFFRARNAARHTGIGLGLGIARQLARTQGGDLTVRSREGEGSTFTLELPRGQDPDEPQYTE